MTHRSAYLVGADGAHSSGPPRRRHRLRRIHASTTDSSSADVRAELPFTHERHFHFDPPWNPGSPGAHPSPAGRDLADRLAGPARDRCRRGARERRPRSAHPCGGRRAETPYELVWVTAYRFSQRLADAFRVGRVFLAGDAAHVMSPFGARGLNSGVADAENLAWKLAWVLRGEAAPRSSTRTRPSGGRPRARTSPPPMPRCASWRRTARCDARGATSSCAWRRAVAWFRRQVNSGRLAEPATYAAARAGPPTIRACRAIGSVAPDAATARRRAAARPSRTAGSSSSLPRPSPRAPAGARWSTSARLGRTATLAPGSSGRTATSRRACRSARLTPAALDELVARSVR